MILVYFLPDFYIKVYTVTLWDLPPTQRGDSNKYHNICLDREKVLPGRALIEVCAVIRLNTVSIFLQLSKYYCVGMPDESIPLNHLLIFSHSYVKNLKQPNTKVFDLITAMCTKVF